MYVNVFKQAFDIVRPACKTSPVAESHDGGKARRDSRTGRLSLSLQRWLLVFPMVVLPLFMGGARPWFWGPVMGVFGFDQILDRFSLITQWDDGRFPIWQETWRVINDHLWTGTGLGTYGTVISLYQTHLPEYMEIGHAHCDYLQFASELGLPGALCLAALVWGYWSKMALWTMKLGREVSRLDTGPRGQSMKSPKRSTGTRMQRRKLLLAGALAGTASFLYHSWLDFNWQIPANQLYFVSLLIFMERQKLRRAERTEEHGHVVSGFEGRNAEM